MTQELIDKLIAHYEGVIKEIGRKRNVNNVKDILIKSNTNHGICHCALFLFNEKIYFDKWVTSVVIFPVSYIGGARTESFNTIKEIKSSLRLRIKVMKTFKQ